MGDDKKLMCRNPATGPHACHPVYARKYGGYCLDCANAGVDTLVDRIAELGQQRDKLQAFKDWTHKYLDDHGVPHHPPGSHGAEGCRIGDRMDWLMAKVAGLQAEVTRLKDSLRETLTPEEKSALSEAIEKARGG